MQESQKFFNIYKSDTWNTGGGCMVDAFFHKNGWVITLTNEMVCIYGSAEEFWNDDGENSAGGIMIPREMKCAEESMEGLSWICNSDIWSTGGGYIVDCLYLNDDWFVCVTPDCVVLYSSDDQFHGEEDKSDEGSVEFCLLEKKFMWKWTGKVGKNIETDKDTKEYEKFINNKPTGEVVWLNENEEFHIEKVNEIKIIKGLTEKEIDDLAEDALNVAVAHIQEVLGQTDGGLAGRFFSDDLTKRLLKDNINEEIMYGAHSNE